jgi:sulfate transport system ATP-binding protein
MSISVRNVSKRFNSVVALADVSLEIPSGSLLALLGPSGSGKTTLLRVIAGLEVPDQGSILLDGEDITDYSARDRKVGFVFQHYALFRHMTIAENVAYGLKVRGVKKAEREARVNELLKLIRLEGLGHRYPSQLSGGQRQRIALIRALAARPNVLLLDEPFGALDAKVRQELRQWLRRLHDEIQVTSVFVTHDQEEAFEVADHVVVMNNGKIEQSGTPAEVFEHPANAFVMDFLGNVNVFHGRVERGKAIFHTGLETAYPEHPHEDAKPVRGFARPHELELDRVRKDDRSVAARVRHINPAGTTVKIELVLHDGQTVIQAYVSPDRYRELKPAPGDELYVLPRQLRIFVEDDGGP